MESKRELLLTVCEHPGMAFDPTSASSSAARWVEELTNEGWMVTTGSLGERGIELHATDKALDKFPKFEGDIAEPEPMRPTTTPREGLDVAEPEQPPNWDLLASVRVEGYGYDVYFDHRLHRFFTRRVIAGGVTSGGHSHTDALYLAARLSELAQPHNEDAAR